MVGTRLVMEAIYVELAEIQQSSYCFPFLSNQGSNLRRACRDPASVIAGAKAEDMKQFT